MALRIGAIAGSCLPMALRIGAIAGSYLPIAYATSVSPPDEAAAWPDAAFLQITEHTNPCSRHL